MVGRKRARSSSGVVGRRDEALLVFQWQPPIPICCENLRAAAVGTQIKICKLQCKTNDGRAVFYRLSAQKVSPAELLVAVEDISELIGQAMALREAMKMEAQRQAEAEATLPEQERQHEQSMNQVRAFAMVSASLNYRCEAI